MKKMSLYLTDRHVMVLDATAQHLGITLAEELRRVLDDVFREAAVPTTGMLRQLTPDALGAFLHEGRAAASAGEGVR